MPVLAFNTKWSLWVANAIGVVKLVTLVLYVYCASLWSIDTDEAVLVSLASSSWEVIPQ